MALDIKRAIMNFRVELDSLGLKVESIIFDEESYERILECFGKEISSMSPHLRCSTTKLLGFEIKKE